MTSISGIRRPAVTLPFRIERRMLAGVVLVGLSIAGGLILWQNTTETTLVLVAATDIEPGHVIQAGDLRLAEVRLDGGLSGLALSDTELGTVVGQTAGTKIHAGEMVIRPDLSSGLVLGPDEVAVTIPVETETIYPDLRQTDEVAVLATTNAGKPDSATVPLIERATVFDVAVERRIIRSTSSSGSEREGEVINITLAVPRSEVEDVAHAIANSELTIVLLPPDVGDSVSTGSE